jgi:hypothetical protein
MAALLSDGDAQRERTGRTRRARLGNSQEVTAGAVLGGDSAEVRVHLYERSFPEEPDTRALAVNANDVRTALDTGAAFAGVTGLAPSRRMIVTCMWGVSDPPEGRAWGEEGGSQMGVAHAPLAWRSTATVARRAMPAAQSAAGVSPEAADWQEHKRSFPCERRARRVLGAPVVRSSDGNGAPEFRFPHPVPPSEVRLSVTRKGRRDAMTLGPLVLPKTVRPP